jgi:hypothetical protein
VAILAILSGQGSLVGMERFSKRHRPTLNDLLGTDFGKSPSDSTDVTPLDWSRPFESGWLWPCCRSLLSCLQGRTPLEGRVRPESVGFPAPAIGQDLSLWGCCEQRGIEELIPESSIERLGEAVLPQGSRLDVGRGGGAAGLAPVP